MPSETRLNTPFATALDLPPGFRLVTLREVGDAFAHAKANAAELGAGTLVFVGRFDLAEFAVVLEPDEPLRTARRAFYAGMAALTDALMAHAPPEKPIACVWPDAIYRRSGPGRRRAVRLVGRAGRPAAGLAGVRRHDPHRVDGRGRAGPAAALSTAIEDEGFDEAGAAELVGSFARHLMVQIDAWQEFGFKEIAKTYLSRLAPEKGVRRDIDDNGDLLVRRVDKPDGRAAAADCGAGQALLARSQDAGTQIGS